MKKTILVVDDLKMQRELTSKVLTKEGYNVVTLASGEDCMTYLKEHQPDLILLDIMMDGVSGIGVLKHIRQKFSPVELPVIMITAKEELEDIVEALEAGANDYIKKPVHWSVGLARIETQLNSSLYHQETLRLKEIEALNALIVTYNHEINTSLAVIGMDLKKASKNGVELESAQEAVTKIATILKNIEKVASGKVEYAEYAGTHKMLDLKKAE